MGQDKALLRWQNRPLLYHISRVAQQVCDGAGLGRVSSNLAPPSPSVWVLTPRVQQYQPLLPKGCQCLLEEVGGPLEASLPRRKGLVPQPQGPLLAFAQGLGLLSSDWVLLLACDLPLLAAAELCQAAAQLDQLPESRLAWLPPVQGTLEPARQHPGGQPLRWEPLCGFYRRRCLGSLRQAIARGERSFQGWLSQISVAPLNLPTPAQLKNCNSPTDWAEALAQRPAAKLSHGE